MYLSCHGEGSKDVTVRIVNSMLILVTCVRELSSVTTRPVLSRHCNDILAQKWTPTSCMLHGWVNNEELGYKEDVGGERYTCIVACACYTMKAKQEVAAEHPM